MLAHDVSVRSATAALVRSFSKDFPMKSRGVFLSVVCVLAFLATAASAQPSAPFTEPALPASAASTAGPAAPAGPRLRSPVETGNRATAPGALRPERAVAPQISIPFGKAPPPPPKGEAGAAKRVNPAAPSGTIDDSAARCESQVDDQLRAACRARLARESKGRRPN